LDLLKQPRSTLPAVTHVDYSARIQTVARQDNPLLYELLLRFEAATQCGVLVNTSFNVRGEPIVCSPEDAYRCFVRTEMDYLMMGNFLLDRAEQPAPPSGPRLAPPAD
jgi:carbamoyltransferase